MWLYPDTALVVNLKPVNVTQFCIICFNSILHVTCTINFRLICHFNNIQVYYKRTQHLQYNNKFISVTFLSFKTRKSLYQGGDFGQDLSVLSLLLSQACLQASHFLFELSDGVFFVHVHRLQHLQLCTQLSVLQLSVFQVNLEGGGY